MYLIKFKYGYVRVDHDKMNGTITHRSVDHPQDATIFESKASAKEFIKIAYYTQPEIIPYHNVEWYRTA